MGARQCMPRFLAFLIVSYNFLNFDCFPIISWWPTTWSSWPYRCTVCLFAPQIGISWTSITKINIRINVKWELFYADWIVLWLVRLVAEIVGVMVLWIGVSVSNQGDLSNVSSSTCTCQFAHAPNAPLSFPPTENYTKTALFCRHQ